MPDKMNEGVQLAVALLVVGVLVAFLLPVAVDEISGNTSTQINQSVGDTDNIATHLNVTLHSAGGSGTNASYNITDTDASTTVNAANVSEGTTRQVSLSGETINVTADTVRSDSATTTYEYPRDFAFDDNVKQLWDLLPLFFVLTVLLLIIGRAMDFF